MSSFDYANLDVYKLLVKSARWFRSTRWPRGSYSLKDQGIRAAQSACLNLAEGWLRRDGNKRLQLRTAWASAGEARAVLDLIDLPGAEQARQDLDRAGYMLKCMCGER